MNRMILTGACASLLALPTLGFAHGGTYRGPQDTVPPSGGGGGGGGAPPTPGPVGPGQPGPGGGRTTPGVTPGQPGGPSGPRQPDTGPGGGGGDLTGWEYWWGFNKEPYLALKAHLAASVLTGSEEYYLGRGEVSNSRDMQRINEATIRDRIVPRLLQALASERSNDIQSSCMIALAKIGESRDEHGLTPIADAIRPFLASSSQELAETAAVSLGILAAEENIPLLTAILEGDLPAARGMGLQSVSNFSARTRAFAAYGLGLIGHRASHEQRLRINATLRRLLDGEGRSMAQRDLPVACVTAMGLTALGRAETPRADGRGAPEILATVEDQVNYLLAFYAEESRPSLLRAHAPTALGRLIDGAGLRDDQVLRGRVAEVLMAGLTKERKVDDTLQESCILALGVIGDGDADPLDLAIRKTLMNVKEEVADQQARNFSLIALAQAASRAGGGVGDPIHGVNAKDRRENARSFLLAELGKQRTSLASWAAVSLAVLERALDDQDLGAAADSKLALATALKEAGSPSRTGALAIACGLAVATDAREDLLRYLEQGGEIESRGHAALGLGLLGDRAALPRINEVLAKSKYQPELLKNTAIALGLLGDRTVVGGLVQMLEGASSLASQAALSSALGFIGDSRSIDPLIRLLDDSQKTDLARAFAVVALGLIADKEPLPWNSKISVGSNYRANTATLTDQKGGILDIL